eukprot:6878621-Lingulodinium_polyedra.AAC.1
MELPQLLAGPRLEDLLDVGGPARAANAPDDANVDPAPRYSEDWVCYEKCDHSAVVDQDGRGP